MKILFICKKRVTAYGNSYGLINSAQLVSTYLHQRGIDSKVVIVDDNNGIDREVHLYRPTHVMIEALWVVPEKFDILKKLHPTVKWVVRVHSKTSFLANEGIAMEWIKKYDVPIAFNNKKMVEDMSNVFNLDYLYLPNMYSLVGSDLHHKPQTNTLDVGCFGALRILKNHLNQAVAAMTFADKMHKKLNFHINLNETQDFNTSIYKNLCNLFDNSRFNLITHKWVPHAEFLKTVRTMDIGMQVSFSESFNIVTADFVFCGVPIVVSKEIEWMPNWCYAENTVTSMVDRLNFLYRHSGLALQKANQISLNQYNRQSADIWMRYLR